MDENKNLDKIDELLESTSSENRVKFNLADIKTTETEAVFEPVFTEPEEIPVAAVAVEPVKPVAPTVQVIEETQTVIFDNEPVKAETPKREEKAEKAEKGGKAKLSVLQLVLIAVVAVATLWTLLYTVDHTLAAQGYSPAFSISHKAYDDDSHSYTCLGYKVQFMYDANGNLTQKCVPLLTKGPNDIREANGEIIEVAE